VPNVAVVTDTTAYLPPDVLREHDIHLVSLYVNWDDRSERELDMPNFDAFYERLRTADPLPTTSQPSIGDFLEVWEPLLGDGRDIVSIHISAGISGTVEAARQATERLGEQGTRDRVTVVDSATTAGGLGFPAMAAARAAAAGASMAEVADRARRAREDLKIWFALDTLEYVRRGGRIGAASAWLGSALKIKPILTLEREVTPVERVRTSTRARARLMDFIEQRRNDGADAWMVQHIQRPEDAQWLADEGEKIMGRPPLYVSEVGPVLGVHGGPGMLGLGSIPSSHLE